MNKDELLEERSKLADSLSNVTVYDYITAKKNIRIDLLDVRSENLVKRLFLRKEIAELNKQVNTEFYNYYSSKNYGDTTEMMTFSRQELTRHFIYNNIDSTYGSRLDDLFFNKNSKLNGKFADCLNLKTMENYKLYLNDVLTSMKDKEYYGNPRDSIWRAHITKCCRQKEPNECDVCLPDFSKYVPELERLNEINSLLFKDDNKNLDLMEGTELNANGEVRFTF